MPASSYNRSMAVGPMLLAMVLIVALLAGGAVLIALSRRGGLGYPACGACKYNLSGSVGHADKCPECGAAFLEVGITPPRGGRSPAMLWSGVALIGLAGTCVAGIFLMTLRQVVSVPVLQPIMVTTQPPLPRASADETTDTTSTAVEIPPPLTEAEIQAMTRSEVQAALGKVAKARTYARDDSDLESRLKSEFDLLMARLREVRDEP